MSTRTGSIQTSVLAFLTLLIAATLLPMHLEAQSYGMMGKGMMGNAGAQAQQLTFSQAMRSIEQSTAAAQKECMASSK